MNNINIKHGCMFASCVLSLLGASVAFAHTVGGPIDVNSNNASATDLGYVYCSDDGVGPADHLDVQIEDQSPPVPGLIVSVQLLKNNKMINISDPDSGDGKASPYVSLKEGNGSYFISVNKTKVGVRNFVINYHCMTASGDHTGTDVGVYQLQ